MSTLAYPSPDFPGPPSVALEVGDDWEPVHAPGTTLAPAAARGLQPHVVVTIERAPDRRRGLARAGGRSPAPREGSRAVCRRPGASSSAATRPGRRRRSQANLFHLAGPATGIPRPADGSGRGAAAEADYDLVRRC